MTTTLPVPGDPRRRIGPFTVAPIGLGCMGLSHAYGTPPPFEDAAALLLGALDAGVDFFDTAAVYGFGSNEELLGRVLGPHRHRITLASKCGMQGVNGVRVIDGRPATIKATCEDSLRRLRTDVIDLYYLHRWDKHTVPIEDSVGALADLVGSGKVRAIGLSEVSAAALRRAHAVHPIAALQSEYSLWTREPEAGVLDACHELGVTFVAFSPLGRGFLTGSLADVSALDAKDLRRSMPRFEAETFQKNARLLDEYRAIAAGAGCTPAQLALAWLLSRSAASVVPIPGTTKLERLRENVGAGQVELSAPTLQALDALLHPGSIAGARYNAANLAEAADGERG